MFHPTPTDDPRSHFPRPWALAPAVALILAAALLVAPPGLAAQEEPAEPAPSESPAPPPAPDEVEPAEAPQAPEGEAAEEAAEEDAEEADRAVERRRERTVRKDTQVVIGQSVVVEEHERARDVVAIGGNVRIEGEASGDVAAIGGSVEVDGEVGGDVVAVAGSVRLGPEAEIGGEVTSVGGTVDAAPGAIVHGEVAEVPFAPGLDFSWDGWRGGWGDLDIDVDPWSWSPLRGISEFFWAAVVTGVLALLACLLLLLARRPVERVARRAAADPVRSGLVGLATEILFFPVLLLLCLILVISIVGIPLLLLVPFAVLALFLVAFLGYVGVALHLGRWLEGRLGRDLGGPFLVLLVGVLAIQVWSLAGELVGAAGGPIWIFAMALGLFGFLVKYLAWTIGLGAAILSRFGTADGWGGPPAVATSPHAPPPPPAPPAGPEAPAAPPPRAEPERRVEPEPPVEPAPPGASEEGGGPEEPERG